MVQLATAFAFPVRPASWQRPPADHSYRVTNPFLGVDLINGGLHRAVDLGNFRSGDPLRAPAPCEARGRMHFDGAIGVELRLWPGLVVAFWHLSTSAVGLDNVYRPASRGTLLGLTGNSGRQPMAAHTHVELWRDGTRIDPEPNLLGVPLLREDDMQLPAGLSAMAALTLAAGVRIRTDPLTAVGSRVTTATERVQLFGMVDRPDAPWAVGAVRGTTWYLVGHGRAVGYVATGLATPELTPLGRTELPQADCSPLEARLAAIRAAGGW